MTDNPGVGDILCLDENRKYRFIQLDTFHAGTFPGAWETLGVVVLRKGNTVTVCSKHNENKKFMEVFPYIVTGQVLNFADWSAYKDAQDRVILQYDNYTSAEYVTASITMATGLTLTSRVSTDCPQQPKFKLKCGVIGFGIYNIEKSKEFFKKDISWASFNPSTDIDSIPEFPICWPAFAGTSQYQNDHCLWLRQKYCSDPDNPKIEEWSKYLEDLTFSIPCMVGMASRRSGEIQISAAERLKNITYKATDGTFRKLYPAFAYCDEFLEGQGRLPCDRL